MANKNPKTDHLPKMSDLTSIEQAKIASAGGKASVESRRRKRTLRQYAEIFGSLSLKDDVKKKMADLGLDENVIDKDMLNVKALYEKAAKGDVAAFNAIRDLKGEKPADQLKLDGGIDCNVKIEFVHVEKDPVSSEDEIED